MPPPNPTPDLKEMCICPGCGEITKPNAWHCPEPDCRYEWDNDEKGIRPSIAWLLANDTGITWHDVNLPVFTRAVLKLAKKIK